MITPYRTTVIRLGVARLISMAGTEAAFVALIAAIYGHTGSPIWVSAALMASIGTRGLASPLAGAIGDRFDRRHVMIASDLTAGAAFLSLALVDDPIALVALATLASLLESPFFPASTASIPNLVPEDRLHWANSTIASTRTFGHLLGPLAGGVLVAAAGPSAAFLANAVSFAASAALVASVRGNFAAPDRTEGEHDGLSAGFAFLRRDRVLLTMTAAWTVLLLGVGVILVAEYPLAEQFGLGSVGYGILIACWGGGAILGAQLARHLLRSMSEFGALVVGTAAMGVALAGVAVSPLWEPILLAMVAGGIANGLIEVAETTIVQVRTPDEVRSRVIAASEACVLVAFGVSFLVGGPLVDAVGPQPVYASGAVGCVLGALMLATLRGQPVRRPAVLEPSRLG